MNPRAGDRTVFTVDPWIGPYEVAELSERLSCLRLSPEEGGREMSSSLRRLGQLTPLLCCRVSGVVEVVNGFKRLRAARELGWTELRTEIREEDSAQAKLLVFLSNCAEGLTDLEQAWVIRSLYREDRLTQPRIAHLMSRDKSWVCRRLMLAEGLAAGVEADVRLGLISVTAALEVARLQRRNQEACARVVTRRGLTTRQTARLVDTLLAAADEAARAEVLARAEAGDGLRPNERPVRKSTLSHGEWLSLDVSNLKRAAVRLQVRLLQRPLSTLGDEAAELARRDLGDLVPTLAALKRTIDRACPERRTDAAVS